MPKELNYATILLSGAGQLGSRHLQGMASSSWPLDIHIHDISSDSLSMSQGRWEEVKVRKAKHNVFFHKTYETLPKHIDVAVIATTADIRPQVIAEITRHTHVEHWILEKILAQSEAALDHICSSVSNTQKAWVNTPRPSLPWHQEIKATFGHKGAMTLRVDGGAWGLACNAIHFLDMLAYWTGETLVEIGTEHLEPNWIKAKRAGNMEVMGTMEARFSGGSRALLSARPGDVFYTFEFNDGELDWKMNEEAGTALRSDGLTMPGRIPYQSEVTGLLIDKLLRTGECELPGLEQSAQMHRVFLRSLLKHWQSHVDTSASEILIT